MDGVPHVPAQVVGEELARIEEEHQGTIIPSTIVQAARPLKSKLHPCFEWNDKKAAKRFREEQASEMLRKIVVEYEDKKGEKQTIRAFVNIQSDAGSYYCHTRRLTNDPELQDNVLAEILAALIAIKNKYAKYKSPKLQQIWDAIEDAIVD
jgi:predicted metal-dependent hydrolase